MSAPFKNSAPAQHNQSAQHEAEPTAPTYTLPFSRIDAHDLPRVGGKGANLGEMTQAGFPVPPGFCITTDAFHAFMQASGRAEEVYTALEATAAGDVEAVRRVGQQVRAWLSEADMPQDVAHAIVAAWQQLGTDVSYAVRSSATAEDLPDASFAGQQDTFLNVTTQEELLKSVRACWVSLFTDRAILYRGQNAFSHRDVYLAVVVQRMILPDVSGILFTADPVSGNRQIITIDASYGLGEALVAGLVSPDLYKVDKRHHTVIDAQIRDKQIAIRPEPEGGTYQETLGDAQRHARVLDDAQVLELAELGTRIEAHYGKPQDIEWCIANREFYIVQSRPITSLFPLPEPRPQDTGLHVYFSFSHAQVMTDPIPPMGVSMFRMIFPFGKKNPHQLYTPVLTSAAGRIYVDVTPLLRVPGIGRNVPNILRIADVLSAGAIRNVSSRPEFAEEHGQGHARFTTLLRWLGPLILGMQARLWLLPPEGAADRLSAHIESYAAAASKQLNAAAPGAPRLHVARALTAELFPKHVMAVPPYLAAGMLARTLLGRIMRGFRNQAQIDADIDAISRGLTGNVTTEMDLQVGDLADAARTSPALVQHLQQGDAKQALATVHTVEGSAPFLRAWQSFIHRYGMRGPSEIDISRPTWNEEPGSLLQVVIANLKSPPNAHRAHHAALIAENAAAGQRLEQAARQGPLGFIRGPLVHRLIRVARNLLPLREHPKYLMIRLRGLIREVVLECAAILHQRGQLDAVDDVWFLHWHEVDAALQDPAYDLRSLVAARRPAHVRAWQIVPPRVITSDGEIPPVAHEHSALPEGALAGSPVSAGTVEGIAKVITDPQREVLNPGEILVAPFTDPGWTPLFINAAGLVMETGGLMTHGSVVAREYGIPAVVSVIDATKKIHSGQRIRVNGTEGYVEFLNDSENSTENNRGNSTENGVG